MEINELNLETSGKMILSTPYHYNDSVAKACTNEIKDILENKLTMNVSVLCHKVTDILNNYY